jgi:hypothetical protein
MMTSDYCQGRLEGLTSLHEMNAGYIPVRTGRNVDSKPRNSSNEPTHSSRLSELEQYKSVALLSIFHALERSSNVSDVQAQDHSAMTASPGSEVRCTLLLD